MSRDQLSAVVLTYNEADNIRPCLASIRSLCDNIFVVDSGSTDDTRDIAAQYAEVTIHPFETHAKQWHWSLTNLPIKTPWVIALDADQQVTPELARELQSIFGPSGTLPPHLEGLYVKRRQVFRGRWIKHGGYYPKYLLKIFRRNAVIIDKADLVDHHFYVAGPTEKLNHDIIESNSKENSISFWIEKHNRYATLLAREDIKRRSTATQLITPSLFGAPDQRTLWLKEFWRRMPRYIRPAIYFFFRYFLRLGFLDGKQGFIFHFMQAFWFRLLVDINIDELTSVDGRPLSCAPETESITKL